MRRHAYVILISFFFLLWKFEFAEATVNRQLISKWVGRAF